MEQMVSILKQLPLEGSEYTTQSGEKKTFYRRGFELSTGFDRFYAEMTGMQAQQCPDYDLTRAHMLTAFSQTRVYTDRNGRERYSTDIQIKSLI